MHTQSAKLAFHIPHAMSLKDKRGVCRSLIDKIRSRFHVSVAEVDTQDLHQTLTLGIAVVSGQASQAEQLLDEVVRFMDSSTDAELVEIEIF